MAQQASTLINPSPGFYNRLAIELADLLVRHSGFDHVFLGSSSAEAKEATIKPARRWGRIYRDAAF